eukprot:TRINITY_DN799_c0_g2_i3.p1 TRINITY_DN799_c0_g2~~TRINITY_DN799_c0_g2_i3.p1  ORF type:complete len:362 (-),score=133.67 TRINITY_DN799_c0_g2_i3:110-1195(-)
MCIRDSLYPEFINTPEHTIPTSHARIVPLLNKTTGELVQHLNSSCDQTWVEVFHAFLGLGAKTEATAMPEAGVWHVIWEGGVRYRNSPNYTDIAEQEQLALPGTEFEIAEFERGTAANSNLWYGYIAWADYYLPVTFQDGRSMMKRIGDTGTSEQLKQLAHDLFQEIDVDHSGGADWTEIVSFLEGARIGFDKDALRIKFDECDVNNDGLLQLDEFIHCYNQGVISNVFCIPTDNRKKVKDEQDPTQALQRNVEADTKPQAPYKPSQNELPTANLAHHTQLNSTEAGPDGNGSNAPKNTDADPTGAFEADTPAAAEEAARMASERVVDDGRDPMAAFNQPKDTEEKPQGGNNDPLAAFGSK